MKSSSFYLFMISLWVIAACGASQELDEAQINVRNTFSGRNYAATVDMLNKFEGKQIYKQKELLLLHLEKGTSYHFAEQYKESFAEFEKAERAIENNYTKSISRGIKSFLVNDNLLVYDGEDYEDFYINSFKALNFLHLNDIDGALVEARRMSYKIENVEMHYNGLADALSKANTTEGADFKVGKAEIQSSSFARYLTTVLFEKTGKSDDGRIEFDRLKSSLSNQQSISDKPLASPEQLEPITQPETYNTLVVAFSGRAPEKKQNDTRIYLSEIDTYIKLSLPELKTYPSAVYRIEAQYGNGKSINIPLIEQMDKVAKEIYKIKEPIIYARTFVRVAAKIIAGKVAENKANEQSETFGFLLNMATKVGVEASEKADLRSWQTMPGEVYSGVMELPAGKNSVRINYISNNGFLLYTEEKTIDIDPQNPLHILETIYWN